MSLLRTSNKSRCKRRGSDTTLDFIRTVKTVKVQADREICNTCPLRCDVVASYDKTDPLLSLNNQFQRRGMLCRLRCAGDGDSVGLRARSTLAASRLKNQSAEKQGAEHNSRHLFGVRPPAVQACSYQSQACHRQPKKLEWMRIIAQRRWGQRGGCRICAHSQGGGCIAVGVESY